METKSAASGTKDGFALVSEGTAKGLGKSVITKQENMTRICILDFHLICDNGQKQPIQTKYQK